MVEQPVFSSKKSSIYSILQDCAKAKDLFVGRQLHAHLVFTGLDTIAHFADHVIRFFASCGKMYEADLAFHRIMDPCIYTWNAIMLAHAQLGNVEKVLLLLHEMEVGLSTKPDNITFLSLLKAFNNSEANIQQFRIIHNRVIQCGLEADVALGSTFVDVYAKCGSIDEAHKIFKDLTNPNLVSWGAMITVCVQHRQDYLALELYNKMQEKDIKAGRVVMLGILKACGHLKAIVWGRLIHNEIIKSNMQTEQSIQNSLIDMYAKCNSLAEARLIFDRMQDRDLVSWSAILTGYTDNRDSSMAFELFDQGQQLGIKPDKVMFLCVLKACSNIGCLEKARMVHEQIQLSNFEFDVSIGNALVDMYAKCRSIENARAVFDMMPIRHIVSWGAMITGYVQLGHGDLALELFNEMLHLGIEPNEVIFLGVLKSCVTTGSISQGRLVHAHVVETKLETNILVANAVIDMYVKFEKLEEASRTFKIMSFHDVVSWNGIITGYAQYGYHEMARHYIKDMIKAGIKVDDQMFTTLLGACSHAGLVEEASLYIEFMKASGVTPSTIHYNCIIDLLSRSGQLNEAESVLQCIPNSEGIVGWMSFLTNSKTYGQMHLGKQSYKEVF